MRGLAIVLMAIDHARDFSSPTAFDPTDLTQASPGLFLTRWMTHFCAPTFVFLAGTSAWLHRRSGGLPRGALQRFLVTRGLWLVVLELTVVSFAWRFDLLGLNLQVIWVLGWSMVTLALLLWLPDAWILAFGVALVAGHDLLDGLQPGNFAGAPSAAAAAWAWALLHVPHVTGPEAAYRVVVKYPLIPWPGVMALGYACAPLLTSGTPDGARRTRWLGTAALAGFLLLRVAGLYGDPHAWSPQPRGAEYTLLDVVNTTKYPPSLQYLLMTLGGMLVLLPCLEQWTGRVARSLSVFGRVPLFFYLVHLPVLHLAALLGAWLLFGVTPSTALAHPPAGYEPSLVRVYVAWALLLAATYPLCRWYGNYKRRHRANRWLSYL